MWRHYPWLLGLGLAPILFGSVTPEGQAVVGVLFAISVLLQASQPVSTATAGPIEKILGTGAVALLILPLIPLSADVVGALSPQRLQLAREFPVEHGQLSAWLPLSVSVARTVQRLWEIALLITGFCLARNASREPPFSRRLLWVLAVTIGLVAASDVWYRLDGQRTILGLWQVSWGKGAGTFANRNLFADWIYVAALFCAAGVMRALIPLQSARASSHRVARHPAVGVLLLLILLFGVAMAVVSGSRGGVLALAAGIMVWLGLLIRRSQSRRRIVLIMAVGVAVFAIMALVGGPLFQRLAEAKLDFTTRYPKIAIWQQSLQLWQKFPFLGTGWGTFGPVFNHFKTSGGETTFLHAENDYVQLLVETGAVGTLVFGAWMLLHLGRAGVFAWREKPAEPEFYFGALAALAGFAAHAAFEFVAQITSTALLAAVLLGFLAGSSRPSSVSATPPRRFRLLLNHLGGGVLLIAALLQALAFWQAKQAHTASPPTVALEKLKSSLRLWPWAPRRQVSLVRLQAQQLANESRARRPALAEACRAEINVALARDPLDWELRLERAWLGIAFSTNAARARADVREVVGLNPLQPQLPLRFARHYEDRDPDFARELLLGASLIRPADLRVALTISWNRFADANELFDLTPDTVPGLLALADFAVERQLFSVAAQACERLTNRLDAAALAEKFLAARRPDRVLLLLKDATGAARLLVVRAHLQKGNFSPAIGAAESIWLNSPARGEILTPPAAVVSLETSRAEWRAQPKNPLRARRLAEKIFQQPAAERDLGLLRELAKAFPDELRLQWIVFQTEREQLQLEAAAQSALLLAARVTR